ncbi:MAG: hypothetical protein R3359_05980 [Marinirhabdus sp.]|nr:hypothetical protein [Marinirhabdus sp.]
MKTLKTLLIAFLATATLISCKNDDDNNDDFLLNNTNLAGTYDLTFLRADGTTTVEVQGIPVTATTESVGDTFQVTMDFNDNGTFVLDGQYRLVTTVTAAGQTETDSEILVIDNETGNYAIDANAQTITFSNTNQEGFDAVWDVTLFNQSEVRLVNETSETNGQGTVMITTEIRFVRQ